MIARRSASSIVARETARSGPSGAGGGILRYSRIVWIPSMTSSGPTRKRSDFTSYGGESFAMICGASIESSLAHTLVATFTSRTPRASSSGRARSAILGPTAIRHCASGIGSCFLAKR